MVRGALVITLVAYPMQAFAEEAGAGEAETVVVEQSSRNLALSASILRAVAAPMAEVGAELKHSDRMASAVLMGAGPGKVDTVDMEGNWTNEKQLCLQLAGQFRYYALGSFDRGMYVGAEAVYIWIDRDQDMTIRPQHEGFWAGPTVGYKYTFDFGMLLSAGLTLALPVYKPDGLDEDEIPGEPTESGPPMVGSALIGPNLSIGWAL